jgi:lipopolysaccharide/colanic/teichoic acid biosynthesis glycosyltransferase
LGVILWDTDEAGAARFVDKMRRGWVATRSPEAVIYAYPSDRPIGGPPSPARATAALPSGFAEAISPGTPGPVCRGEAGDAPARAGEPATTTALAVDTADHPDGTARSTAVDPAVEGDPPPVPVLPLEEILLCPLPAWKRAFDIVGASVGLVALSPLLLATAAAVKLTSPGPALFRQTRDGLGGRKFLINKFRTMVPDAEAKKEALRALSEQDGPAFKMERDPRITPLGRWLRKTCIDELPQLWNVLRGEMSLVGPRPLDSKETAQTSWWERRRLLVTPGLTCIWQVDGKSKVTFKEWMRMDIRYMHDRTLVGDLGLILRTARNIALHRGSH